MQNKNHTNLPVILYIGGFELPNKSAAAKHVMANAEIFSKLGYFPVLIGVNKQNKKEKYFCYHGIDCYSFSYPQKKIEYIKYLTSISNFLFIAQKYKNIKYIVCYDYEFIAFSRLIGYARKKRIPIISDITELYNSFNGSLLFQFIKKIDNKFRIQFLNYKVDGLILTSQYLKKLYINKKSIVLPTRIPSFEFENIDLKKRKNRDVTNYIYAGIPFRINSKLTNRHEMKERIDIVLHVFNKLLEQNLNFHLDIIGITKDDYLLALPEDSELINHLKTRVTFWGKLSSEKVMKQIASSDFSILIREKNKRMMAGFPTKFTESICCGTPVIATNTSDISQYLVNGKNGFFVNDNLEDLESLLKQTCELSISEKEKMKRFCINNNPFSIEKWKGKMKNFLDDINTNKRR